MPVRVSVTKGTAADCSQAVELIEGIDAEYLLADKAYDTNAILSYCEEHEVIPSALQIDSPSQYVGVTVRTTFIDCGDRLTSAGG